MGGFDAEQIRSEFSILNRFACMAMIAIGYQVAEAGIPQELREREYAPRSRRPLNESFFVGEWHPFE